MIDYRRRPALSQIKPAHRLEQALARGLPNWIKPPDKTPLPPVGASLLAMAVGQVALMLGVLPSSRASSLPQGIAPYRVFLHLSWLF
mgnify:CR=1 FL=1